MNELEKCLAGKYYDCHDEIFLQYKNNARNLLAQYNALPYDQTEEKRVILQKLCGSIGDNVSIASPFICDYGCNIHIGSNVSVNMNCTFVDCNKIIIGNNVLIASNVQLYTATDPVDIKDRFMPGWYPESKKYFCQTYALPITIGNGCWIGGGVIVLPGVTIGGGSVIGAGSVVTKNIPANCVAVGNPARVIRRINKEFVQ